MEIIKILIYFMMGWIIGYTISLIENKKRKKNILDIVDDSHQHIENVLRYTEDCLKRDFNESIKNLKEELIKKGKEYKNENL